MYKQLTAFIFLVAFIAHTFNKAAIVIDYYSNISTYAKNCENKDRPVMHCNGKCHMMKLMKQDEKKDQENPERKMENKLEIICFSGHSTKLECFQTVTLVQFSILQENTHTGFISSPFHPPQG